jgi:hypothetical protein
VGNVEFGETGGDSLSENQGLQGVFEVDCRKAQGFGRVLQVLILFVAISFSET